MKHLIRALKDLLAPLKVQQAGPGVTIEPGATFDFPSNITLGAHARVARRAMLRANTKIEPGIRVGERSLVLENALINANEGHVNIGDDCWIGPFCLLYGNGGIDIGNGVLIAAHTSINTVSHNADRADQPMSQQGINTAPVVIEDDVWIGLNASILQGVRIGTGSIIGAGSVVTRDIPPYSIAVGTPARVLKSRKE
ncbi:MAG: acyltransferase [Gammaproteobacteria bacterium]